MTCGVAQRVENGSPRLTNWSPAFDLEYGAPTVFPCGRRPRSIRTPSLPHGTICREEVCSSPRGDEEKEVSLGVVLRGSQPIWILVGVTPRGKTVAAPYSKLGPYSRLRTHRTIPLRLTVVFGGIKKTRTVTPMGPDFSGGEAGFPRWRSRRRECDVRLGCWLKSFLPLGL